MAIVIEKEYNVSAVKEMLEKKYKIRISPNAEKVLVRYYSRSNYIQIQQVIPTTETKGKIEVGSNESILKDFQLKKMPEYRKGINVRTQIKKKA